MAACDKGHSFDLYRDSIGGTPKSIYPLGVTEGWSPNSTYYVAPEYASAAISAVDSTSLCHGVAASRDGNSVYFSTDSTGGSSRIFNFWGWVPNGAAGQAPKIFSVAGNSYYSAAANTGNRLGVATMPLWVPPARAAAAPLYKGLAQAPSGLTLGVLTALFATQGGIAGSSVLVTPSSGGAAGAFDVRCAPGFFGSPILGLTSSGAVAALASLSTRCSPCTRPAALDASVFFLNSTSGGFPGEPQNFLQVCKLGFYSPTGGLGRSTCVRDAATLTYTLPTSPVCAPAPAGYRRRRDLRLGLGVSAALLPMFGESA